MGKDPQHGEDGRDDLARMAEEARDATFGETGEGRVVVPGVLSGDVGPKGRIASQHRALSRRERATALDVPPGSASPGGLAFLLVPMLLLAALVLGAAVLIAWLVS